MSEFLLFMLIVFIAGIGCIISGKLDEIKKAIQDNIWDGAHVTVHKEQGGEDE